MHERDQRQDQVTRFLDELKTMRQQAQKRELRGRHTVCFNFPLRTVLTSKTVTRFRTTDNVIVPSFHSNIPGARVECPLRDRSELGKVPVIELAPGDHP